MRRFLTQRWTKIFHQFSSIGDNALGRVQTAIDIDYRFLNIRWWKRDFNIFHHIKCKELMRASFGTPPRIAIKFRPLEKHHKEIRIKFFLVSYLENTICGRYGTVFPIAVGY